MSNADAEQVDRALQAALNAIDFDGATRALRALFVERLDFAATTGQVRLDGPGLPPDATRIARRAGIEVVAVAIDAKGRIPARPLQAALASLRRQLNGELLLLATDADRSQWHFVYPSAKGGREVLRRMMVYRGQPHRTVAEQLANIFTDAATSGDLRGALDRAFDVEAVTKRFYERYREIFEFAMARVEGLPDKDERQLFCQTLFNRLMFLYFLQRKGWLTFNGDPDYLPALWRASRATPGENFYAVRLSLLFFTALNNPRSADYDGARGVAEEMIGKVPFLNGGLFEKSEIDKADDIVVPNEVIGMVLDELFARFNFTITESTPYDEQIAIDPEMLGKVFEELVTGRHDKGSYYTPRPIVTFMCREALKGYLAARVPGLPAEAAAGFIDRDEVRGLTLGQAPLVLEALKTIAVVDPACGSGAYLLGMLHELVEHLQLLYSSDLIKGDRELYELKLEVIERNLYGVDIDQFAVNIAMLRLWLSLAIDFAGPGQPPALPNLAFKIVRGDSLLAPDPQPIVQFPMFASQAHEHVTELRTLKDRFLRETGESKRAIEQRIKETEAHISQLLAHDAAPAGAVDWRIKFAEAFDATGGFDVVLANPPYVRQELIVESKPRLKVVYGSLYSGTADLYVYFYYRALQLLRDGGMLVFISSNKWFRANYGARLRAHLAKFAAVWSITDFGDLPVFASATAYPMIFIGQKGAPGGETRFTQVKSLDPPYPDVRALIDAAGQALPADAINGAEWRLASAESATRGRSMALAGRSLGEYVGGQLYRGVVTGFNKAFVINGATRARLIAADPRSAEVIEPLVVGRDIRKWAIDRKDTWLIVTRIGVDMARYPAIFAHLEQWLPELVLRRDQGNHWWELRACAYYAAFEQPKIVFPDIAVTPRFAFEPEGAYLGNTAYVIPLPDLYLLGVLNSRTVEQFYRTISAQVRGGYLRFIRQYVEQIPIPEPPAADRNAIADLARQCLEAAGQGPEVAAWEAEIDARVARLYGLAAE